MHSPVPAVLSDVCVLSMTRCAPNSGTVTCTSTAMPGPRSEVSSCGVAGVMTSASGPTALPDGHTRAAMTITPCRGDGRWHG